MNLTLPSHDALSAMPGDDIVYDTGEALSSETVRTSGWQPTPKGGKVWTYETMSGVLVPNTSVREVRKKVLAPSQTMIESVSEESLSVSNIDLPTFLSIVDKIELPTILKSAIHCMVKGGEKHLEVAGFLIDLRAKQVREDQAAAFVSYQQTNFHQLD